MRDVGVLGPVPHDHLRARSPAVRPRRGWPAAAEFWIASSVDTSPSVIAGSAYSWALTCWKPIAGPPKRISSSHAGRRGRRRPAGPSPSSRSSRTVGFSPSIWKYAPYSASANQSVCTTTGSGHTPASGPPRPAPAVRRSGCRLPARRHGEHGQTGGERSPSSDTCAQRPSSSIQRWSVVGGRPCQPPVISAVQQAEQARTRRRRAGRPAGRPEQLLGLQAGAVQVDEHADAGVALLEEEVARPRPRRRRAWPRPAARSGWPASRSAAAA